MTNTASGYFTTNQHWPDGSTIQMELQLGATNVVLQDEFKTWNDSAADALSLWNPQLATVQFSWVFNSTATQAPNDGKNSVFFSDSVFGDSFGEDVLAIALVSYGITEGDVIVNQNFQFNSYRGPLQKSYDIHRTLLHEFGHVLGLDHPDEHGQDVEAIMNSTIGDLDHLAPDDMDGAWSIYGVMRDVQTVLFTTVGDPFSYQVTTNVPAMSYSATGLPNGMTIDSQTGRISGVADLSGVYNAQITFNGHELDVYDNQVTLYVNAVAPQDFRASFPFTVHRLLADPFRPRVYASLAYENTVAVVDTTTLSISATIPLTTEAAGMALSPDGQKLFLAETGYPPPGNTIDPAITVIDANSLTLLSRFPTSGETIDVAAGLDNRLFVAASNELFEMNAVTGQTISSFPPLSLTGHLALNLDSTVLHSDGTYFFDVSTTTPTILQQNLGYSFSLLSHDGKSISTSDSGAGFPVSIVPADDLSQAGVSLVPPAGTTPTVYAAFSVDDSTLFTFTHSTTSTDFVDVYSTLTGKHTRSLEGRCESVVDMVIDASGQFLFAASSEFYGPLLVYGTGLGTPFHPAPAKRLLNISTRLATAPGDDVLIGGFIIAGQDAKEVAIRALGPSLPVAGKLLNPVVDLYNSSGKLVASNDNWNLNRAPVLATGLAPADEQEAALIVLLEPGPYTAVLHDAAGPGAGIALIEVYDLTPDSDSTLANISTRGKVDSGDDVMIGGFIISNDQPTRILLRAIGPSLGTQGIPGGLQDPVLELHNGEGDLIITNDNWRALQEAEIMATGIPPADDRESAIIATLEPGAYTAIVRGQDSTTGVGLVEIYNLDFAAAGSK